MIETTETTAMILPDSTNPDRVTVVGELNPYGGDPAYALVNYPPGCAGHRLWRIMGVDEDRYLAFSRVNLCVGTWSMRLARGAASMIRTRAPDLPGHHLVVLLGARVTRAFDDLLPFGAGGAALCTWGRTTEHDDGVSWVSIPHPSGLCRAWGAGMWSAGGSVDRTRVLLRELAPRVPWGSYYRSDLGVMGAP